MRHKQVAKAVASGDRVPCLRRLKLIDIGDPRRLTFNKLRWSRDEGGHLQKWSNKVQADEVKRVTDLLKSATPDDYQSILAWSQAVTDAVQQVIIHRVEPAFNHQLASLPRDTLQDKQSACRWANQQLRDELNLAIRCPKTNMPTCLVASPGNDPKVGRFQLEVIGSDQKRWRTISSPTLFEVQLSTRRPRTDQILRSSKLRGGGTQVSSERSDDRSR